MASMYWQNTEAHSPSVNRFYFRMASACLAITFFGFMPSYFFPLVRGSRAWPPIIHIHGLLFFAWVSYFWWQNWLIISGQPKRHLAWGLLGISLTTAMICASLGTIAVRVHAQEALGFAVEGRKFAWISLSDIIVFGGLLATALAKRKSRETHKRLALMATISLLGPPIGRLVFLALSAFASLPNAATGAPPPVSAAYIPHILSFALVAIAMWRDIRILGRIHPAYLTGLSVMVMQLITLEPIATSQTWQQIAGGIAAISG